MVSIGSGLVGRGVNGAQGLNATKTSIRNAPLTDSAKLTEGGLEAARETAAALRDGSTEG